MDASNSSLFRQEVLDAQRDEWLGTVRLATPVSHAIWTNISLLVSAAIVAWLFLGHYTRRERVSGTLVPQAGLIDVTARASGTVAHINVDEGSHVHAGDPLLILSGERTSETMGDTAAAVSAQLRVQLSRLQADIADSHTLASRQEAGLHTQERMLRGQLQQLDAQLAIQQRQVQSAQQLLEKIQPLAAKGYISAFQIQQQETTALNAKAQSKVLARQRYETRQQLGDIADQVARLPLDTQTRLNDLNRQLAQVEQSLAENEAQRASVLRAPHDGLVSTLLVKQGQAVTVGQSLLAIVPQGTPLQAQLLVPSSAVGFIRGGDHVMLRYQAFPYQKFGLQSGQVVRVSRNALRPAEITELVGQTPPEPLYRVQASLASQHIEAYNRR